MKTREEVVRGVSKWVVWWVNERKKKLENHLSGTMSVNPFMLPFLFDYHGLNNFSELLDLTIGSHLMTGHNTGFGKLIDEKILPGVFDTVPLTPAYRRQNPPLTESCFDEIDHIVIRDNGTREYLSLKAGRWTIQLTMAVQLNDSFTEILHRFGGTISDIVVGVFYGRRENLTDKYDILRGVNRGANHNVMDLTDRVFVHVGRGFWSWLNYGEVATQEWILEGILHGAEQSEARAFCSELIDAFKVRIAREHERYIDEYGNVDWQRILRDING